jgi:hypothetical protein
MHDHANYIHTVARIMKEAGFHVLFVGGHDWQPRGGHIVLGCQDGWDDYREDTAADVLWDERNGWRIKWLGITDPLCDPSVVASPTQVAFAVGAAVGQTPTAVDHRFDDVRAEPGTPEFEAALAAYEPENAR